MEENREVESRRFEFKVSGGLEQPAIWFYLKNREVAVYPFELLGFLWDSSRENFFSRGIMASFHIYSDEVWGDFKDKHIGIYSIIFDKEQFIDTAKKSLKEL